MHRNTLDRLAELAVLIHKAPDAGLVEGFLREILTPSEIEGISFRWELVKRLDQGLCKITRGSRILKKPDSALRAVLETQARRS